ncbi:MAG: CBO2463/CBO2479 domain-containing protein [Ruminococcus sp.]
MQYELKPILTKGKIVQVNDTAIKVDIQGRLGVVTVPRRCVFTDKQPEVGQHVEFYFSYLQVID